MHSTMSSQMSSQFEHSAVKNYQLDHAYDEMFSGPGDLHKHCELLLEHFSSLPQDELQRRKQAADLSFLNQGITFTVYGREEGTGEDLSIRSDSPHHHRSRVGDGGARAYAANSQRSIFF